MSPSAATPDLALTSYRRWTGSGSFRWHRATFEQQPTTFHIVNGLTDLDVREVRGATLVEVTAPGLAIAGVGQRTVEPAEDNQFVHFPVGASAAHQLHLA